MLVKRNECYRPFFESTKKYNVLRGGSGCIHGDSLLDTPNGKVKIKNFHGGLVYSWDGSKVIEAYATAPKKYDKAALYRVTLSDGSSIKCTGKHRFLTNHGWIEARAISPSDFFAQPIYVPYLHSTNLGTCLSIQISSVRRLIGKVQGFLSSCLVCRHRYDEQLHSVEDISLDGLPLLADARGHILQSSSTDDLQPLVVYSHPDLSSNHLSKNGYESQILYAVEVRGYHSGRKSFAHFLQIVLGFLRSLLYYGPSQLEGGCNRRLRDQVLPLRYLSVDNITYLGQFVYYDITVPSVHNYIAHGMIHHNSGKSYAVADDVILRTLDPVLSRTIVARKVAATMRQSVFRLIQNRIYDMGLDSRFSINKTEMTFTAGKNEIVLVGLDDVNKLKSIYDPTDAWLEESDQIAQSDFEEIDRRIRTLTGRAPKITLSFNPTSAFSWLKKYFYDTDTVREKTFELTTTYKDNAFLDPAYAETIERLKETNPSAYRVYGLGEWGVVEGVVFDSWSILPVPESAKLLGYGLDFGYSNDPTSLVAVYTQGNNAYYDEIIYQTGLTNSDLIALMKQEKIGQYDEIIADSAEPKSIEEIRRAGFNIHPCVKGADSVRNGINAMKQYKQNITPRSVNTQREFSSYSWKQDKDGRWLPVPIDLFNHAIDAIRYRISKDQRILRAGPSAARLGL